MRTRLFFFVFMLVLNCPFCLLAQNDTTSGWDKIFRTSDLDGEIATQPNRRWSGNIPRNLPEGSTRVGCVCMNGAVRPTRGTGSCNGRGGVRFWLIKTPDGDTIQQPTMRHEGSPDYEPEKFVGPNPNGQPTIIIMPTAAPNGQSTPSVNWQQGNADTQIIVVQTPVSGGAAAAQTFDNQSFMKETLWLTPMLNFGSVVVICLTIAYILRLLLAQPSDAPRFQVFKRIRITLIKILFRNNRFFK